MVSHHRSVVGGQWPIRCDDDAWRLRREQYRSWLTDSSGLLLVAHLDDVPGPVGYLFCRLVPSGPTFDLGPVRGEVDSLATTAGLRGKGVGTVLLTRCRAELLQRGCTYWSVGVIDANPEAARLYQRLGFQPWNHALLARLDPETR